MTVLYMILILLAGLVAAFLLMRFRVQRAVKQVVKMFRSVNAVDEKSAISAEDLGIIKKGMLQGMFRVRDFKPQALESLVSMGVINFTEDARYYINEEKLEGTPFDRYRH
ncbi:hypothetical protein ACFLW1_01180 [Chloroflexota bacterium]